MHMQNNLQTIIEKQYALVQREVEVFTPLARKIVADLAQYLELVKTWTTKVDLVSMQSDEMLVSRHIIDCVCAGKVIASLGIDPKLSFADVGSGAGLPGIILALLDRERKVHLIEPRKKRCGFLQETKQQLGLENVEIHEIDFAGFAARYRMNHAANAAKNSSSRSKGRSMDDDDSSDIVKNESKAAMDKGIGLIIARAIGMRERYLKQAWKLVNKNGFVAEMLGAKLPDIDKIDSAWLYSTYNFTLPPDGAKRTLWFWGKKRG